MPSVAWESDDAAAPFLIASIRCIAGAVEIESKAGRFLHVVAGPEGPVLRPGPAPSPGDPASRHWQDLTERLPGAFDDRPALLRIEHAGEAARPLLRLQLSTGRVLQCRVQQDALTIEELSAW